MEQFSRTELLLGAQGMEALRQAHVAVFGIGGVGSFAAEALARSGVGHLTLIDKDTVSITNLNRQLIATQETIGRPKVEIMKERILSINPQAIVDIYPCFYTQENKDFLPFSQFSYVIDAIDTVSSKLLLIAMAKEAGTPVISSMGAGNKLDPTAFRIADISETSICPLAKVMRKELKVRGIQNVPVVFSTEPPRKPLASHETVPQGKHQIPGSIAFVPSVAGLIIASKVVRDLAGF